jgi:predicted metal-dependent peptidase
MPSSIESFRSLLEGAIDIRENALFPENPAFALPLDSKGEEITLKEQALLKCLLGQFNNLFGVE